MNRESSIVDPLLTECSQTLISVRLMDAAKISSQEQVILLLLTVTQCSIPYRYIAKL